MSAIATRATKIPRTISKYWIVPDLVWQSNELKANVAVEVDRERGCISQVCAASNVPNNDTSFKVSGALFPGLINCHSHAFQIGLRGKGETYDPSVKDSFWTWRQEMYKLVDECALDPDQLLTLATRCYQEMRDAGITTVGEFHYFRHSDISEPFDLDRVMLQAAAKVGIRVVLLNTFYHFGGFGDIPLGDAQKHFYSPTLDEFWSNLDKLSSNLVDTKTQSMGVAAHSLRAVNVSQLKALHKEASCRGLVFHLHIEEQPAEVEACKAAHKGLTPMGLLLDSLSGSDFSRTTAVHCNHTVPLELETFTKQGGMVCICPLTEGNLGDGIMPEIAKCNGSVCVGTDCNAKIDLFEELRWLEYTQRLGTLRRGVCTHSQTGAKDPKRIRVGEVLFDYATRVGAKSLGVNAGEISPGKLADLMLIDIKSSILEGVPAQHLPAAIMFGASASQVVKGTCIAGEWSHDLQQLSNESGA